MTLSPHVRPLELAIRRHLHLIPGPVRERLRTHLSSPDTFATEELEAWDHPLTASSADHPRPVPQAPAARRTVSHAAPAAGTISCALVTAGMDYGGLAGVVADLARGLPDHGVRIHVAALGDDAAPPVGRVAAQLMGEGIAVAHLGQADFDDWMTAVSPQVVSSHGAPDWALRAAQQLRVPVVDTLHGGHSFFGEERISAVERAGLSSIVVTVSDMIRQQFLAACPAVPPEDVVAIPNGTGTPPYELGTRESTRLAWDVDEEFVFVSLGRFSVQKNAFGLVAAFRELDQGRYPSHLVIAGDVDDPRYVAQVTRLRDRAPRPDRIHLRRSGPAAPLLAGADCFVLDSFFEGWALASMEALVAGLPTISSEVAGAREQLTSARPVGHLVPNPLGDPLAANWQSTARHKFGRQANRDDLVQAMQDVFEHREDWARQRSLIAAESLCRFDLNSFYRRHAHVLSAAAAGAPVALPRELV